VLYFHTGVDGSAGAIELATRNAALNGIGAERVVFSKEDISTFMAGALKEGKQWDVVILDPPKLAPNKKFLPRALNKYKRSASPIMETFMGGPSIHMATTQNIHKY
jgi:23S rRNA G2069 N7-methylase RlmK/C1962 C5-methylase RlmI